MRFGIFLAPFHAPHHNPNLALHRDLELIEHLDQLGYDEAWIGEHHSAGYEIIANPEVFMAYAAALTRNIKLGTGVVSLAYHHPLMVADRWVLLDHLTRGRCMFGVGPGSLPSDAYMMGIEVPEQRRMMEESLEAIMALLTSDEPVTRETDWFQLRNARLQLRPYTQPCFEVGVAAMVSPSGPRAAGRFGLSLLSLGATQSGGFDVLASHWEVMEERCAEYGHTPRRDNWRLVGPMHIAETAEQARKDVQYGLDDWLHYFRRVAALPIPVEETGGDEIDALNDTGFAVIGTPDDAIAQIERLQKQSGGFGTFLFMANDWADREAMFRSYELFAREVIPRFQPGADAATASMRWAMENRTEFIGKAGEAIMNAITQHHEEKQAKTRGA